MKKIWILFLIFIIFTYAVCCIPQVTGYDIAIIRFVQEILKDISPYIPHYAGKIAYNYMIAIPLIVFSVYFYYKKLYRNILVICSAPLIAYLINTAIKVIIQRNRPPFELQIANHPLSFSYFSRHTFITTCLFGMVIYFTNKYCKNNYLKYSIILFSIIWILAIGFSRIWIGVHYPTDVFGAYLGAIILLLIYIDFYEKRVDNSKLQCGKKTGDKF